MYQFIHVETYSKVSAKKKLEKNYNKETKGRNVDEIIAEATRKPDYCDHVAEPEEPVLLYGVDPSELKNLTDEYFNNTKLTNSNGISRGLRKDSHVLLAGVISLNKDLIDIWDDYKKDAINWLKEKYGHKLKCVIEHKDEENPHIHFYCVQDPGISFDLLHDGKKAFSAVGGKLKYKKEIAFKQAMRDYQENFYNDVSLKYGLLKTGPRRQRLSNTEYKAQRNQIDLINGYKRKIEKEAQEKIISSNNELKKINLIIDKAKKEAFNFVIDDFNNKNFLNKTLVSITFNKEKIKNYDKIINKNKNLNNQMILMQDRKNYYKNKYFNVLQENKELIIKKDLNNFLNFDINNDKENINDISRRKEIDQQIKRFDGKINELEQRQQRIRAKYRNALSAFQRLRRGVFDNIKNTIDHFFKTRRDLSITRERSEFEIKDTREIEKIITEKNKGGGKLDQKRKLRI